jgi:hypothetical protein
VPTKRVTRLIFRQGCRRRHPASTAAIRGQAAVHSYGVSKSTQRRSTGAFGSLFVSITDILGTYGRRFLGRAVLVLEAGFRTWADLAAGRALDSFRNRTPGPSPSASMNMIPARSRALISFSVVSGRPPTEPSAVSSLQIVGSDTPDTSANSLTFHPSKAKAALSCREEMTFGI